MVSMFHTLHENSISFVVIFNEREYLYLGACHSIWNSFETQVDHHGEDLSVHDRVTSTLATYFS